jgi:NADPH-dependent glutamate synthase beta subunit-like oxidoreductase/coenzyme F420-reducing hydrogenase delta subunit/Pyruvate/2-oxoacid:ferredoxin oxidoreductase delta subunit
MREVRLTSKDITDKPSAAAELMEREWAPCRYNCPVHADVRAYLEHIAQGRWGEAVDTIRRHLAFAAVCGRVCHHPCEANCRRGDLDSAVAIRELKRFVAELQGAAGATVHRAARQDKARVAIVGGGPAGMAAALELAKLGYRPTVFERFPRAGGIPAIAIPEYRLPREVLQIDVDWICAHGVELVTAATIGKDKTIDQLRGEGFRAALIAAGLSAGRDLPIPGAPREGLLGALEFLTDLGLGRRPRIGDDVLVIGGGNVAVDAARSAVRLGAGRVRMMCLETRAEMPAFEWEQREAEEEGISFIHRRGPAEALTANGRIVGIKARKVTRVFDELKRFDPRYDDTDLIETACDTLIIAIGQAPDYGFLNGSGVRLDARGRLEHNPATCQTNVPDVFACGEIVTPPGSVVEACASGRRAAKAIDMYLSGKPVVLDDSLPPFIDKVPASTAEKVRKVIRQPVSAQPPEMRRTNLEEVDHNYNESAALREARRCMSCGAGAEVLVDKCAACLTCLRVCPFDVPVVTDVARIDSDRCQSCGICIAECPANAIVSRSREAGWIARRTAAALEKLGDAGPRIVAYLCGHVATAAQWRGEDPSSDRTAEVYLPSLSALSTLDILRAFENGADAVLVAAPQDSAERYPQATKRLRKRVAQARKLLKEIGLKKSRIQLFELTRPSRSAIRETLATAVEDLRAGTIKPIGAGR